MYAVNHLPLRDMSRSTTGCCPMFEPAEWDGQTFVFDGKPFMKFETKNFMYIPLNMNAALKRTMAKIYEAGADVDQEYLMLSEDISPWKSRHYIAITDRIEDSDMVELSGKYIAKVFEGPFKNARIWYKQLIDYVVSLDKVPVKTYFSYTTCPKCAKVYGKNYVVGFEQVV